MTTEKIVKVFQRGILEWCEAAAALAAAGATPEQVAELIGADPYEEDYLDLDTELTDADLAE